MDDNLEITVFAEKDKESNNAIIRLGFPKEQGAMSVKKATHLLIAGVTILIKSCSKTDLGIKDYELLKEVITHLNNEFVSTYNDAEIDKNILTK